MNEQEASCDGIHDEGAPTHYLCTRCFPDAVKGDLSQSQSDEVEEDERQETE